MHAVFIVAGKPAFGHDIDPYLGAAYRYGELLRQLCPVEVIRADDPRLEAAVAGADLCVVRADRFAHYRLPLAAGVPYLAIAHDLASMRDPKTDAGEIERDLLEHARAIVFATGPLQEYAAARCRLPASEVIPLRPSLADLLDLEPQPKLAERTLVYAGGIVSRRQATTAWGYRAIVDELAACRRCGWQVHVYPTRLRPNVNREYAAVGCVLHNPIPERHMLSELSQYTAGLQVFHTDAVPAPALEYARLAWPNKAWLYQAAGIPTIGLNPGFEAARIFEQGGWGIALDDPEQLRTLAPDDLPEIDAATRHSEVIDADLPRLASLLERVTLAGHWTARRQGGSDGSQEDRQHQE
jgi:hypothetical protein